MRLGDAESSPIMERRARSETMENKPKFPVLVVNDEPSIRKYLQTLLEVDGFDVATVSSGKEAPATPRLYPPGRADAGDGRNRDAARK